MTDSLEPTEFDSSVPKRVLIWLAVLGLGGPILFDAVYLVEGATRPGYDAWREPISTLMEGPGGWVQQADFVLLGLVTLGAAVVWRQVLRAGKGGTAYPVLRLIEGSSLVLIGFTLKDPLHTFWLVVILLTMMAGLVVMAWRFWGDPNWRGWSWYSVAAAVLINVLISLFGATRQTPLGAISGVFERLATNVDLFWALALVVRLWAGVPLRRDA